MKTQIEKINENKEIKKAISKINYYDSEMFLKDCKRYIKAIKERRMSCVIDSVSRSGMSRNLKFSSCEKGKNGYYYSNYNCLFLVLGFSECRNKNSYFTIGGCGMDMVFNTNYTIIHRLQRIGIIDKKQCEILAQMTPVIL